MERRHLPAFCASLGRVLLGQLAPRELKTWLAEREKSSLDKFGGWTNGPTFKASGFFRTEKRDGRWYLVTGRADPGCVERGDRSRARLYLPPNASLNTDG